jgi:hypothetical protein
MNDFRLDMSDGALDDLLRGEMAVLRDTAAVPAVRVSDVRPRRLPLLPRVDPAHPRRLVPAALALGVAVLIALGGGAWYSVGRLHGGRSAPATSPPASPAVPTAPPAPLPALLLSTVPPGVPVVYYSTYANQPPGVLRLQAIDWRGERRGHIDLPGYAVQPRVRPPALMQSPDGERLLINEQVYTSDGHYLFTLPAHNGPVTWGDDSRSLCVLTSAPVPGDPLVAWNLTVVGPDGAPRPFVSLLGEVPPTDRFTVGACAVSRDVVVASWSVSGVPAFVRVTRMSSNQQLFAQGWGHSGPVTAVAFSADGRWAAESDSTGSIWLYDLNGGAFRQLAPTGTVVALSGDGSHLLIGPGGGRRWLAIIRVPSDELAYHTEPASLDHNAAMGQPGGPGLAYAWYSPLRTPSAGQPLQLTFELHRETGGGSETKAVDGGVWTTWFHQS